MVSYSSLSEIRSWVRTHRIVHGGVRNGGRCGCASICRSLGIDDIPGVMCYTCRRYLESCSAVVLIVDFTDTKTSYISYEYAYVLFTVPVVPGTAAVYKQR